MSDKSSPGPVLSVIIPVYNEEDNVVSLADEVIASLKMHAGSFELIFIDDASTDETATRLAGMTHPCLRIIRHRLNAGQSAAVATGFQAATSEWLATLDGDGQNDPADLPAMLELAVREGADCITGIRANRHDNNTKRISSKIANRFRNAVTGDRIADSGCGIRVIRRDALREIPVFNGMHRFLPTLLRGKGYRVLEHAVNHRERTRGTSKYGINNRLWRGIRDCFGVRWYIRRSFPSNRLLDDTP